MLKKAKVIYNPNAGKKRNPIIGNPMTLADIKELFYRYQIPAKYFSTKGPGDAALLAKAAGKEKYDTVIAAGGDGTISEVVNGLIGTDIVLGILPLGSFMNTPRMLSIPTDLEKAVMLIKIGRTRKIDVGKITNLGGEKPEKPLYFMENSSVGIEAEIHESTLNMERGNYVKLLHHLKSLLDYYQHKVKIYIDSKVVTRRVSMVAVSNGQFTDTAIKLAPRARLNDHRLTVSVFQMSKKELLLYFLRLIFTGRTGSTKIQRFTASKVQIKTKRPKPVHADGQVFGETPVSYEIQPNALTVITGFPESGEVALEKRTSLDPEPTRKSVLR